MRRLLWLTAITLPLLIATSFAASPSVRADDFPTVLQLPDGWLPEGIAVGNGTTLYSGSRRHGGIYAVDLETGVGHVLVPGREGRAATGLKFDARTGYIFASGAATGDLHVYNSSTGDNVASYKLAATPGPTFINDVILTPYAAYLTDSMRPVLYRVPLGQDGSLPAAGEIEVVNLKGDYVHQAGFNVNGIETTPSGDGLIIVQSNTGRLFEVNPFTGNTTRIDLGSDTVLSGDGLLMDGRTLYVVRNPNEVVKIQMAPNFLSGHVVGRLTNPGFDATTTAARSGNKLYVVNVRSTAGNAPSVKYTVVAIDHVPVEGGD